jgi:hypothetical protein
MAVAELALAELLATRMVTLEDVVPHMGSVDQRSAIV